MMKAGSMGLIVGALFVLIGCKSSEKGTAHSEENAAIIQTNPKEYLKIVGSDAAWYLSIAEDKISFIPNKGEAIEFPYNLPDESAAPEIIKYNTVNGKGTINIELLKQECGSNSKTKNREEVTDKVYAYQATVEMVQLNKKTTLTGCASYVGYDDLEGKWMLSKIGNTQIEVDENKATPFLEFDFGNKRVSGNAGCNGLSSSFKVHNKNIEFTAPILTRMFCDDSALEKQFTEAIPTITKYKKQDDVLFLYKGDAIMLTFKKWKNETK